MLQIVIPLDMYMTRNLEPSHIPAESRKHMHEVFKLAGSRGDAVLILALSQPLYLADLCLVGASYWM